ncbi:hypothetical protein ACIBU0_04380 [Streptomyces sp. NPDC049627]|uniref:hypothetical protein n=1 Tax=Streptomyces sp. NPDC049627 TaxID=3365595 RepID=UPI0037A26FEA
MELRARNTGANTADDHVRVLASDTALFPVEDLVRVDAAGAIYGLPEHLQGLNTKRRTVRYTIGWKITPKDEAAIKKPP